MRYSKKLTPVFYGCVSLLIVLLFSGVSFAQDAGQGLLKEMKWRCIGPANFGGRIVDVEALESDFSHVITASASGGVWKSINAGTTWEPIFDDYQSASIGDIALSQRNPEIIWVGTGEANNRNSVAWGNGVYKTTDGGKTFTHMGLEDTYQVARIILHPQNDNTVYVAAIGNLWGYSGDRGLFKTTDGGRTWKKLTNGLPDDGKTGAIDLVMDPKNPNTLYVAMYQRLRKPYRFDSGGPNGGIFKSADGGASWTKLTNGLPKDDTGRIGLDIYRKNPNILVAIIENGFHPREDDPDYSNMSKLGSGVYRSEDGGKSWKYLNRYNNRPFYYSQIRINQVDPQRVYVLTTTFMQSEDGGKTLEPAPLSFEGGLDYHAMWLDPNNKDRYYLGMDKGLKISYDHGASFVLYDNMPIGQFYAVGVDMRDPYYVFGGTQDNGTWGGPSFSKDVRGILDDSWWKLHWGDGMFIQIDPNDWRTGYTEAENGSFRRYDMETRRVESSRPSRENIINYDEFITPEIERRHEELGHLQPFRFNWRAPLVMSPHNPNTLYLCGNHLFKTVDRGYHWQIISPDLTTNDTEKINRDSGGLTPDITGAEMHCSITAISESPLQPGLIWVGTDDGNVQVTRNGGVTWANVRSNIRGVPNGIWVSNIEASHFDEGVCYVTFDGHRSDEYKAWIFKTADFGETWTNITGNIPEREVMYVIREDLKNPNLLFAGSEFTCFVSLDGGKSWTRFMNNMPTVAFHDLVIHPRDGDLIAATHGRSFWILDDITPLQQLTDEVLASDAYIFEQRPATIWEDHSRGGVRGQLFFAGDNPPYIPYRENIVRAKLENGGLISYYLKSAAPEGVVIEIADISGANKKTLYADGEQGINRVQWDLRFDMTDEQRAQAVQRIGGLIERIAGVPKLSRSQRNVLNKARRDLQAVQVDKDLIVIRDKLQEAFGSMSMLRRAFRMNLRGDEAPTGTYRLTMTANGQQYYGTITVRCDPMLLEKR